MASPSATELKAVARIELGPSARKLKRMIKRKGTNNALDAEETRTLQRLLGRVAKRFS